MSELETDTHEGVIVARQPIFDAGWGVVAYELLYRPLSDEAAPVGPEAMTAGVMAGAFGDLGLDLLVGVRSAHINVTRDFLLDPDSHLAEIFERAATDEGPA